MEKDEDVLKTQRQEKGNEEIEDNTTMDKEKRAREAKVCSLETKSIGN